MSPRALATLNAIGCLALTSLVVVQWRKERALDRELSRMTIELAAAENQAAEESKRRVALERDIAALKDAIEATQRASEASARALGEKDQLATQLQSELSSARGQVLAWEAALKARDEQIRSLDANLEVTRKRLDEAIARIKTAAAH